MGLMMGRMGELPNAANDRFREYVVFVVRGFGSFKPALGTGRYGAYLEEAMRIQSCTHREILSMMDIRGPLTNRIAKALPILDRGIDYGYTPNSGTIVSIDFIPCPSAKLGDFRIDGDKRATRGEPPA